MSETGRIDIALPAQSTIAELIPLLARAITPQGEQQARFELSRLGGAPLPGDRTVAAAGLRDGELLHLVAVGHGTAVAVFDDLVEAVASNVRDAPGRWRPALSRRVATGVAVLAFGGAALASATMAAWPVGPIAAGLTALLLLAAGVTLTRVRDAATIGAALAAAGLPCVLAAVFGWSADAFATGPTDATQRAASATGSATAMLMAFASLTLYALLSAVLLPSYRAWFLTAAATGGAGTIAAASVATGYATPGTAAAVMVVLAVVTSPAFPILSLRLGRLPVPEVPTDLDTFRATDKPTPASEVAERTLAAEAALTSLLTAEAVIVVAGGAVLLQTESVAGWSLTALAGLALLVRSRAYLSIAQRATLLTAGTLALVATAAHLVPHSGTSMPLAVGALALLTGTGCAVHAIRAGHRPPSPYWARFLDIIDFISVTALVPAGAAVLGLYGSIQSLAS